MSAAAVDIDGTQIDTPEDPGTDEEIVDDIDEESDV